MNRPGEPATRFFRVRQELGALCRRSRWVRWVCVFAGSWIVLAMLAGPRLTRPSANNHYVHLAAAWLDGRLDHGGVPPGYCSETDRRRGRCQGHTFDDWAVVWTLTLDDGQALRGYPCRTAFCRTLGRREGIETWWVLGEGWRKIPSRDILARQDRWYVSFPPGPAVLFVPWVLLWGLRVWDVCLLVTFAALVPVLWVAFLDRIRGTDAGRGTEHLVWAAAWALGSPACALAAHGEVWFTAQIVGALALVLFLRAAWLAQPAAAGWWLTAAMACRPTMVVAALFFAARWWKGERRGGDLVRFVVPLLLGGAALATLNLARFGDAFEFGHRFLEIRWQPRIQTWGMFSWAYLERNFQCLAVLMPRLQSRFPFVEVSMHGMALWLSTPWLLLMPWARGRFDGRWALWCAVAILAVVPLFYQNSGQVQFSYRFALDWLPLVLLAMAMSGLGRLRRLRGAVLVACAIHLVGAYAWIRMPGRLFVTDPPGWPFEQELDAGF